MKPKVAKIYSENNDFQYIETLRRKREKRQREQEFFIEGVRPIDQAIKHNWTIDAFVYSREKGLSDWAKYILAHTAGKTHVEVSLSQLHNENNMGEEVTVLALLTITVAC